MAIEMFGIQAVLCFLVWNYLHIFVHGAGGISLSLEVDQEPLEEFSRVTLVCETFTNIGRTKWFQNGKRMAVTRRQRPNECLLFRSARKKGGYEHSCKRTQVKLTIPEVMSSDTGNWSCEDPQTKSKSNILSLDFPSEQTEAPRPNWPEVATISGDTSKIVDELTPLWLTCSCRCDTNFIFMWEYGDLSGNVSQVERSNDTCSQSLTLLVSSEDDGTEVTCLIKNPDTGKTAVKNVALELQISPKDPEITVGPTDPVAEGDTVHIRCRPQSKGKSILVVRAGNDATHQDARHVTFQVSRQDDNAEINCYVVMTHPQGSSMSYTARRYLHVIYSPKLRVTSKMTMNANKSQSVTFTCAADGNPPNATFKRWKHRSMSGDHVLREIQGEDNSTHSILRLTSLSYHDNGLYICNATNGVGKNGSRYRFHWGQLDVDTVPYFPDANNEDATIVTTSPNTTFTVTFRYVSKPKGKVTWFVRGDKLLDNVTELMTGTSKEKVEMESFGIRVNTWGFESRLTLPSVTSDDDGNYFIQVCNVFGCRNSSVIQLRVAENGDVRENVQDDEMSAMTLVIGLTAGLSILVIVVIVVIVIVVYRRRSGEHSTSEHEPVHKTNGVAYRNGNPAYGYDNYDINSGQRHHGDDKEQESVLVVIKSNLYGKSLTTDNTKQSTHEGAPPSVYMEVHESSEKQQEEDDVTDDVIDDVIEKDANEEQEKDKTEVSEDTQRMVTEIYSQVQKPSSSQKGSTLSDDVKPDSDDVMDDDAFQDGVVSDVENRRKPSVELRISESTFNTD